MDFRSLLSLFNGLLFDQLVLLYIVLQIVSSIDLSSCFLLHVCAQKPRPVCNLETLEFEYFFELIWVHATAMIQLSILGGTH